MAVSGGEYDAGPFYVRFNDYTEVGDAVGDHCHDNMHWTQCRVGVARVGLKMSDGTVTYTVITPMDHLVPVPATALHSVEALEVPCRTECLFQHRNLSGVVTEKFCGNTGALR